MGEMILYNKAFDINHTTLRMYYWLANTNKIHISLEKLRLYDFIIAFPFYISCLSLSRELLSEKTKFKKFINPYNNFDARSLFNQMEGIQKSSICSLVSTETLIRKDNEIYEVNSESFKEVKLEHFSSINVEAINFIKDHLEPMSYFGKNGLKAASKLMSFKYDIL
nr:ABC-three component system middle component 5 [Pantoea multigeneris]